MDTSFNANLHVRQRAHIEVEENGGHHWLDIGSHPVELAFHFDRPEDAERLAAAAKELAARMRKAKLPEPVEVVQ